MNFWFSVLLTAAVGYLLGNLNASVLLSAWLEHDDVRTHGSGNAGFTNYFRNYGGLRSLLVLLLDAAKAAAACLIGGALLSRFGCKAEGQMLGAVAVTLGHDFPVFLGFRGGKGIVCGVAAAAVMDARVALILVVVFFAAYFITHYVSLGSCLGAVAYIVSFALLHPTEPWVCAGATVLGLLALWLHRENIRRLLRGEERKTHFFHRGDST